MDNINKIKREFIKHSILSRLQVILSVGFAFMVLISIWAGPVVGAIGFSIPFIIQWHRGTYRADKFFAQLGVIKSKIVKKDTDYYCLTNSSAIAVNTKENLISVIYSNRDGRHFEQTFVASKIRGWRAFQSSKTTYSNGLGVINSFRTELANEREAMGAARQTGLTLELDDVMNPEILIHMDYESACKWFMIFEKLFDGTLEPQNNAMFFPRDSVYAI